MARKSITLMRTEEKSLNLRENIKVELSLQNSMAAKKESDRCFLRCLSEFQLIKQKGVCVSPY